MSHEKKWSEDPRIVGSDARITPSPICRKIMKNGTHVGYGFFTERYLLIYDSRMNPDNRENFPDPLDLQAHCKLANEALKEYNDARNAARNGGFSR